MSSVTSVKPERVHHVSGTINDEIMKVVTSIDPHLLAMGSLARRDIAGILIVYTAEKVFRLVGCSILTVKPENFQSPILN